MSFGFPVTAANLPRDVVAIDYAKSKGLVAAAYQGGQVVIWEFESGRVRSVFNAAGERTTRNKPLARFSASGRYIAVTAEGDAGLIAYDLDQGPSTVLIPRRLLYLGIKACAWSHQEDSLLVAIGRDIAFVSVAGRIQWQRRLETRSVITDVAWHPSERFYTVATDDASVSSYETISGQVIASALMETVAHPVPVKVGWTSDSSSLVAGIQGGNLALLDPETLKPRKSIPCTCTDFDWSPAKKELAATAPPNILVLSEFGQKAREIRTPFEGAGPILWTDETHILAGAPNSAVVLREARSPKITRTFAFPMDKLK